MLVVTCIYYVRLMQMKTRKIYIGKLFICIYNFINFMLVGTTFECDICRYNYMPFNKMNKISRIVV